MELDLKETREELNLTQAQIAQSLGIHINTWSNYENGKTNPPETVLKDLQVLIDNHDPTSVWQKHAPVRAEGLRIERYLLDSLKANGADKPVFVDLVNRYMQMWETSITLEEDIKNRGVSITSPTGVQRKNDSVAMLVTMNKQMLMILDKLGLNANSIKQDDGIDV